MRMLLLIAFGLQVILGTSCMTQTASAQQLPPESMMTRSPLDSTNPHAGCHPGQEQPPHTDSNTAGGGLPCLGHCLSQATARAMSDSTIQAPCPPATIPTFTVSLVPVRATTIPCPSASPNALAPPGHGTVVLLQ